VRHGLAGLETRFRRADGLYRSTDAAAPLRGGGDAALYDQAFVLLALASAAGADGDIGQEAAERARRLANNIRSAYANEGGGYCADLAKSLFLADPLMHLFEASLAWMEIDPDPSWRTLAGEIADLFSTRMVDHASARIFEAYDAQWRPVAVAGDDRLEPGHHFEWAWLLRRWAALGGGEAGEDLPERLYATGKAGIAPDTGLVVDALNDDLSVARGTSRLWPQTERLRAALSLEQDPQARAQEACAAARAMERYFAPASPGLWLDAPADPEASDPAPSLASSFYHIVGAIAALDAAIGKARS
jgi:mannose-6-phosphate isomerase